MPENKVGEIRGKFSMFKVDDATAKLKVVVAQITEFEKVWRDLTEPEQAVVGGVVFNAVSIWGGFSALGNLSFPPIAGAMIDQLINYHNRSLQNKSLVPTSRDGDILTAIEKNKKGGNIN